MGVYSKIVKNPKTIVNSDTNNMYIIESSHSKRRWKCPYCDYRDTRTDLVSHVNDKHEDMLSDDYPASRAVFNFINKKERGRCIQCSRETRWNDTTWRYERLCERKKCHDEYVKYMKNNMINVHGQEHLLNDPEKQKEMLANRKISGTYKFADGGVRTYCGSYERKLLEFYDTVLNAHSKDVLTPGPIVEYEYNGKILTWITDLYYVPANLVHDVKDGGDNPNNRQMDDYRAKQIAKEDAISKLDKYNYIRLTNNNFEQLLLILAEIKYQMIDNSKDHIIRINESELGSALPNENININNVYLIPYMINNSFNIALSTDRYLSNIYKIQDNKIEKGSITDLYEATYDVYKYTGNDSKKLYADIVDDYNNRVDVDDNFYFYTKLCKKQLLSKDQLSFDENLEEEIDNYTKSVIDSQINEVTLIHLLNEQTGTLLYTQILDTFKNDFKPNIDVEILQDINGYFIYNECTKRRTRSYDSVSSIPYINMMIESLR